MPKDSFYKKSEKSENSKPPSSTPLSTTGQMKRVAFVGTRDFPESKKSIIEDILLKLPINTLIVSGGARGPDRWAVEYAKKHNYSFKEYLAKKGPNGEYLGPWTLMIRNTDIVNNSDYIVALWDGESKGTLDTLKKAKTNKKPVLIVYPDESTELLNCEEDRFFYQLVGDESEVIGFPSPAHEIVYKLMYWNKLEQNYFIQNIHQIHHPYWFWYNLYYRHFSLPPSIFPYAYFPSDLLATQYQDTVFNLVPQDNLNFIKSLHPSVKGVFVIKYELMPFLKLLFDDHRIVSIYDTIKMEIQENPYLFFKLNDDRICVIYSSNMYLQEIYKQVSEFPSVWLIGDHTTVTTKLQTEGNLGRFLIGKNYE